MATKKTKIMKTTIYHPKCKELFGTIEKLNLTKEQLEDGFGEYEIIDSLGFEEWLGTFEEAKKDLLESLENHYNGSTQRGMAEDREYESQERFYCGNE